MDRKILKNCEGCRSAFVALKIFSKKVYFHDISMKSLYTKRHESWSYNKVSCLKQGGEISNYCLKQGQVLKTSRRQIYLGGAFHLPYLY